MEYYEIENLRGEKINALEILKNSSYYETFYNHMVDLGCRDYEVAVFWDNYKDYCGVNV